ncbi:MAG: hypothetical protein RXR52_33680 [Paraburkholderia sp.]|uniref:hypothetical protein n=1 Tax=Paraburkholderia sp. TaxID=1926495 RepID=UPI00397C587B
MRPHIYFLRGQWTCAATSGGWAIWPLGRGDTPRAAFCDWVRLRAAVPAQAAARIIPGL